MAPVSDLVALRLARLTPQQAADMALAEDRAARAAWRRGDPATAVQHERERDSLCDLVARDD